MKQIFKVIFISIISTIGAVALVVGGMYLFGAFNDKPIYAKNLSFSSEKIISSHAFSLQVNTADKDVNKMDLVLETSQGGDKVINYPKKVRIGEPFSVMPRKGFESEINVGGCTKLYARYEGSDSNQAVIATCTIMIDVPVEEISIKIPENLMSKSEKIDIIKKDEKLFSDTVGAENKDVFSISPKNAFAPYFNGSILDGTPVVTTFNISDKKIFLKLVDEKGDIVSFTVAQFLVNGNYSSVTEVKYSYKENAFVFDETISVVSKSEMGEFYIKAYISPDYETNKDINVSNYLSKDTVSSVTSTSVVIRDYEIQDILISSTETREAYLNEEVLLYLNNPEAEKNNNINLGIKLHNERVEDIAPSIYINNLYIYIKSSVGGTLTNYKNVEATKLGLNVFYDGIDEKKPSGWYWKFKYSDFMYYYKYAFENENPLDNQKKIVIGVYYKEKNQRQFEKEIYITPKVREVKDMTTNYPDSTNEFVKDSGKILDITNNNFTFKNNEGKAITLDSVGYYNLEYYLPFAYGNNVSTVPTLSQSQNKKYLIDFVFKPAIAGKLMKFDVIDNWASFTSNAVISFTQNGKEIGSWICNEKGEVTNKSDVTFEANYPVYVKTSIKILKDIKPPESTKFKDLFVISIYDKPMSINEKTVKFREYVDRQSDAEKNSPYLTVNNVSITSNFNYYSINGEEYLHLVKEANGQDKISIAIKGIGAFQLVARLSHIEGKSIYWLNAKSDIKVRSIEQLESIYVYSWDNKGSQAGPFLYNDADLLIPENSDIRYVYITSPKLEALKSYADYLTFDIFQDFNSQNINVQEEFLSTTGKSLKDLNKSTRRGEEPGAIEIGEWRLVTDAISGKEGFVISYKINEIYSIELSRLNNGNLETFIVDNLFKMNVGVEGLKDLDILYVDSMIGEPTNWQKQYSFTIVDKTYKNIFLEYGDGSTGTEEKPVQVEAVIAQEDGSLRWDINGVVTKSQDVDDLKYGFKYNADDNEYYVSGINGKMSVKKGSLTFIDKFYQFKPNELGGGLTLKNIPYYNGEGILLEFKVNADMIDNNNVYYAWDSINEKFTEEINKDLKVGKSIFFLVKGLNIKIKSNDISLDGKEGKEVKIFGSSDAIFTITGASHISDEKTDLSALFTFGYHCVNSKDITVSSNLRTLKFNKNFITDDKITFKFSYFTDKNPLYINESTDISHFDQIINSAFRINTVENLTFTAPSKDNLFIKSIMHKDGMNALDVVHPLLSYSIRVKGETPSGVTLQNNKFSFIAMTKPFNMDIILTINRLDEGDTIVSKDILYNVLVNPKYKATDIEFTKKENKYDLIAGGGKESLSLASGSIIFKNRLGESLGGISAIEINCFDLPNSNPIVPASQHMIVRKNNSLDVSVESNNLKFGEDKTITLNFKIFFKEGGFFEADRKILIKGNLNIILNPPPSKGDNPELQNVWVSGDHINLGDYTNYTVKNNETKDESILSQEDFRVDGGKYSRDSFVLDDEKANLFVELESGESSILKLMVDRPPQYENQKVTTYITFKYKQLIAEENSTEQKYYILEFKLELNLFITKL